MKTRIIFTMIIGTFFLTSCGETETKSEERNAAVQVVLQNPTSVAGSNLTASGQVAAVSNATLSTRMMGYVTKVHVGIGEQIKEGQLLVSINSSDVQAKRAQVTAGINQATIGFHSAKKDFERFTALFAQSSASQKELDDVTSHYEMAKAQLASAEAMKNEINAQFAYLNITAPFSGVVTNQFVETGDMAHPGVPLIAIEAPRRFEVRTTVPASAIVHIKTGQEVTVLINSIQQQLKGTIAQISSSASVTGGQFPVKIALEKNDTVKSGMYATVQFPIINKEMNADIVTIEKEALITQGDLQGVYTVSQQNTALLRWLRLGRDLGGAIEVLSGLNPDESYILSSEGKLYNGVEVEEGSSK